MEQGNIGLEDNGVIDGSWGQFRPVLQTPQQRPASLTAVSGERTPFAVKGIRSNNKIFTTSTTTKDCNRTLRGMFHPFIRDQKPPEGFGLNLA